MSTVDTFDQILNRLEHLDRSKGEDLSKLKKIVLVSSKDEMQQYLNELDSNKVISVFKKLLKSDEKFIAEDVGDIFNQIQVTLGVSDYYRTFANLIRDVLSDDSSPLKSIHLKLLLNCCTDTRVQASLIEDLLSLVIDNIGDQNEEVGRRSIDILQHLSTKVDRFLEDHLFNSANCGRLESIKNKNEINKFRYFEFLISLVLAKETFLQNEHVQQGIKELLHLTCQSTDDPLVVRNCLIVLDQLIENNKAIDYLDEFGYFSFIGNKITDSRSDLFVNLMMPGYLETFAKLGSTAPALIANHQTVISQIVEFILTDNFTSCSIESIGLIGRLGKGKSILNSNPKFVEHCLPRFGQLLDSTNEYKVELLNCLSSLFDLNDLDATVDISNLLDDWYSRLMNDRKKTTQTIFVLCKQVFPEIHINTLNLIRILCKHQWGLNEFAQLNTFVDYVLNRNTEVDYKGKEAKFKLVTELATSPFASRSLGGINHAKIRKIRDQGAFYVEQDVTVAVEGN